MVNLAVDFAGLKLKNPLTVASGTFAPGQRYAELWQDMNLAGRSAPLSVLGALTSKGVSAEAWPGNNGIRIDETFGGMLNSIGLENPGVEAFVSDDLIWLAEQQIPIIVNVCGHSVEQYCRVIERLESEDAVSAYEINISCPNVDDGGMVFGTDANVAFDLIGACRALTRRTMVVKLTPNVTDVTEVARAAEAAGADALSLINTVAGMSINLEKRSAVFDRVVAGLSGPAIKPIALWAVYRVYQACDLPLIGMGGIGSATDCIEFMLAGATMVAVGTRNFSDPLAVPRILADLAAWCDEQGVDEIGSLIGALGHL